MGIGAIGLLIVAIGAVVRFAPELILWFGHLPGDFHFDFQGTTIFLPITSMLIVSVLASVLLMLFHRR